ncbi:hypothetical protein ACFL0G_01210 [Candidatus Zixiibacteriota bacterium]
MKEETGNGNRRARCLWVLAMVNVGIWAISMIALIFVMQRSPAAKGLFPILAGGSAVGILLISVSAKLR